MPVVSVAAALLPTVPVASVPDVLLPVLVVPVATVPLPVPVVSNLTVVLLNTPVVSSWCVDGGFGKLDKCTVEFPVVTTGSLLVLKTVAFSSWRLASLGYRLCTFAEESAEPNDGPETKLEVVVNHLKFERTNRTLRVSFRKTHGLCFCFSENVSPNRNPGKRCF